MNVIRGHIWLMGVNLESRWSDRYVYNARTDSADELYSFKQRNCAKSAQTWAMYLVGPSTPYQGSFGLLIENLVAWVLYGIFLLVRIDDGLPLLSEETQVFLDDVDVISQETILKQKRTKRLKFQFK